MRFSVAAFTLFGALATASASTLHRRQLPSCATTCLATANLGTCQQTDTACLCKSSAFVDSTTTCITSSCQGSDLQSALSAAQQLCAAVGVTLTSTPAALSTVLAGSSTAPAGSSTAPAGSSTAPAGTSSSKATSSAAGSSTSSTAPATTTSKTSSASSHGVNGLAGLAAIGLAALAL